MIFHEPSRKMRKWLVAKTKTAKVGKCCQILIKELCHNCDHCEVTKVAFKSLKQPDMKKQVCRNCIALMYKTAYGEEIGIEGYGDVPSDK